MRKTLSLYIISAILVFLTGCSTSNYLQKDFGEKYKPNIRVIAFLPVESSIDTFSMSRWDIDSIEVETAKAELRLQIFEKMSKDEAKYSASFQDPLETDKLLYQAGIKAYRIDSTNIHKLKEVLGCDAILTCNMKKLKLKADKISGIGTVLGETGELYASTGIVEPGGYAVYSLWDCNDGEMIWQQAVRTTRLNYDQNMQQVISAIVNGFSKKWPFKK